MSNKLITVTFSTNSKRATMKSMEEANRALMKHLIRLIQQNLTDYLLKPKYKGIKIKYFGHCYVATECFYFIYGRWNGWFPYCHRNRKGETHWWLQKSDEILDITSEQFNALYPYEKGHKQFFVNYPSKRCLKLVERIKKCLTYTTNVKK